MLTASGSSAISTHPSIEFASTQTRESERASAAGYPKSRLVAHNWRIIPPLSSFCQLRRWQGYAFERFCRKNHRLIAKALGFSAVKYSHGPFFNRSTARTDPGYQIDLVFDRADKTLSLCEIKFSDVPVSVAVGREFQTKLQLFDPGRARRIESVLIAATGVTQELRDGGYFDRVLRLEDIVQVGT
jgi:hypothetical protein